jgi:hypothetical protein
MSYEYKPGTFSLFKNDKGDNEKRPDYRGTGKDHDGHDIEVAAWLRQGNSGKFMSCTFKRVVKEVTERVPDGEKPKGDFDDMSDDIPF